MKNKENEDLTTRCQYLVRSKEELTELEEILKNAPVRLGLDLADDRITQVAFFYGLTLDELKQTNLENRDFNSIIEYNIDATHEIDRKYPSRDFWVKNSKGKSAIGPNHLVILSDKAEEIKIVESDERVFVGYKQNGNDYLIYFQLSYDIYPYI